jgi:hypothetical protein
MKRIFSFVVAALLGQITGCLLLVNVHADTIALTLTPSTTSASSAQPVTLTAITSELPVGDALIIQNETLGYEVGPGTISGTTYTFQDSHASGSMTYAAEVISSQGIVVASTPVTVSWSGTIPSAPTPSYSVSCDPSGDGGAILTEYLNGENVGSTTIPLVIGQLQISGVYAPPLQEMQIENSQTFVPTSTFPVYVRPDGAFNTRLPVTAPGHWPVTVTELATITPPNGATDPSTGEVLQPETWSETGQEVGQSNLYVAAFGLPKEYPDDSMLSISITVTDSCGGQTVNIPNLVTLADLPVWDLTTLVPNP